MKLKHSVVMGASIIGLLLGCERCSAESGQTSNVTITLHSVTIARPPGDVPNLFAGNYYLDSGAALNLQILMRLNGIRLLPLSPDAIYIETLMDDTYQSLLETPSGSYASRKGLSQDGSALIFYIGANRPLAPNAGRVFLRGRVQARAAMGDPIVRSARIPLIVGQSILVGDYRVLLRSITDHRDGNTAMSFSLQGDTRRVLQLRALDGTESGRELTDPKQTRFEHN